MLCLGLIAIYEPCVQDAYYSRPRPAAARRRTEAPGAAAAVRDAARHQRAADRLDVCAARLPRPRAAESIQLSAVQ